MSRVSNLIYEALIELPREQQTNWEDIHHERLRRPHAVGGKARIKQHDPLDTLLSWTPEHRAAVCTALGDFVQAHYAATSLLEQVAYWSPRMSVALACIVADAVLPHVPFGEYRGRLAVDIAARWAREGVSPHLCRHAQLNATDAQDLYARAAKDAAYVGQTASAMYAAAAALSAASAVAAVASYGVNDWITPSLERVVPNATASRADAIASLTQTGFAGSVPWSERRTAALREFGLLLAKEIRLGSIRDWIG